MPKVPKIKDAYQSYFKQKIYLNSLVRNAFKSLSVIPAKAGIQLSLHWIPAFAGMTAIASYVAASHSCTSGQ